MKSSSQLMQQGGGGTASPEPRSYVYPEPKPYVYSGPMESRPAYTPPAAPDFLANVTPESTGSRTTTSAASYYG